VCRVSADSGCGQTTVLDGFTITAGKNTAGGGGMFNNNSSPTVANCAFSGNTAENGGGMYNTNSEPDRDELRLLGERRNQMGRRDVQHQQLPTVTNCAFSGNSAKTTGGGNVQRQRKFSDSDGLRLFPELCRFLRRNV
jgi:hypothetical protein